MKNTWIKLKQKISNLFKPKKKEEKKDYLSNLIENLEVAQKQRQALPFEIKSAKRTGFVVKVKGLYAFVSFYHMPWEYRSIEPWRLVAKHLVGKKFFGVIHSISQNVRPVKILVNAENHVFAEKELVELKQYKCIIIQRSKYGFMVDLGIHFGWKYGSITGLIHKSSFERDEDLIGAKLGDVIKTYYHGRKKNGDPILGDKYVCKELYTGELENLINTIQPAVLTTDEYGKRNFFIQGKYKTVITINPDIFGENITIRKLLNRLPNNSSVECKVIRISKKNNFVAELSDTETNFDLVKKITKK